MRSVAPVVAGSLPASGRPHADLCGGYVAPLYKALTTEDGPSLGGFEGDGRFFAALRTGGSGFDAGVLMGSVSRAGVGIEHSNALRLAGFTALGLVFKLLVVEKELFPGGEHKLRTAVDAGEYLVLKFH